MASANEAPKWKRFEHFVADIQRKLAPDASVEDNVKLPGATGVARQVDVCIRKQVGQFGLLIVMDCKDWQDPVDVKGVEEFCGLVEDVGANKGAMVCNRGFTEAAKSKARLKGIDLFEAVDVESTDWPSYVSIPVLCDFRKLRTFSLTFRHSSPGPFKMPNIDPRYIVVFSESGQRIGNIITLVKNAWNAQKLPYEPGRHENLPICNEPMFLFVEGSKYGPIEISTTIIVDRKLCFGQIPLIETKGFRDEITGSYTTASFTTTDLDVQEVERSWQQIGEAESLSVRTLFTLESADHYASLENAEK